MKWSSFCLAASLVLGSIFCQPADAASHKNYKNCTVAHATNHAWKYPDARHGIWHRNNDMYITFSHCDNESPAQPLVVRNDNGNLQLLVVAMVTRARLDIETLSADPPFPARVQKMSMTALANLKNLKHGHDCQVFQVDAAKRFQRCALNCGNSGDYLYTAESDGIFQMCMMAAMSRKKVKISYVQSGAGKSVKRLLTYMRFEVPKRPSPPSKRTKK